jgi:hypothetical protein
MLRAHRLYVVLSVLLFLALLAACGAPETVLVVRVLDNLTQRPIAGAECRLGEESAVSSDQGECRLARWSADGTVQVTAARYQAGAAPLAGMQAGYEIPSVTTTVGLVPDRFEGQVLDDYTGAPVAAAQVMTPRRTLAADDAGRFTVLTPTFPLSLTVRAEGYDSGQGSFFTTTGKIVLRPNTLTGVVTSLDTGLPLPGAVVTLTGSAVLTTTTGSDGTYLLRGVPERFSLQSKAPQHRGEAVASLERTTVYDIALRPAYLRGLVLDQNGQPISQTRVIAAGSFVHTDAAGRFFFPEVPETVVVQALAPGFAKQVVTVTQVPSVTLTLAPFHVQGIYVTAYIAGTSERFNELLDFVDATELNAIVIEVKDAWGAVTYDSQVPLVQELRAANEDDDLWIVRYNVQNVLRKCHERGIYVIGYIVTFEDSQLPEIRPEWAIHNNSGGLWEDRKGLNWTNPYRQEVWEYHVSIARELASLGFDEVQFDYIRFPTDGSISEIFYSEEVSALAQEERVQKQYNTIAGFVQYAYNELGPGGVFMSADVFGYAAWRKMWEQGQDISLMGHYLDYLCPMAYPSHYSNGELGCANPASCPYEIVLETTNRAYAQFTGGQRARVRTWVQDFTLGGDPDYGPFEVSEQIRGNNDGGGVGFCLWNAGNWYTERVDYSP